MADGRNDSGDVADVSELFQEIFGEPLDPGLGGDVATALELTPVEARAGVERTVDVETSEPCTECSPERCATCDGSGKTRTKTGFFIVDGPCGDCVRGKVYSKRCKVCRGRGERRTTRTLTVQVPAGVEAGQVLRLKGQGSQPEGASERGHVFVHIEIERAELPRARVRGGDGSTIRFAVALALVLAVAVAVSLLFT